MKTRWKQLDRHKAIYQLLEKRPGLNIPEINRALGLTGNNVRDVLTGMERSGFLLSEDDRGGLYAYRRYDLEQERRAWAVSLSGAGFSAATIVKMIYGYRHAGRTRQVKQWVKDAERLRGNF